LEPGVAALVAAGDALALRLLGEVRAAQPSATLPRSRPPTRPELLSARLDLACLRIAERPAGGGAHHSQPRHGRGPGPHAVRRSAARVAERCHEAARRILGAPDGGLTAGEFDELFPWAEGWAQAALGEGLFVAAGSGYGSPPPPSGTGSKASTLTFQSRSRCSSSADSAPSADEEPLSRPVGAHRRSGPVGWAPPVPVPGRQTGPGVPPWRLAMVRQALLGLGESDPQALESLLSRLVLRLDGPEAAAPGSEARWWAERVLSGTLQRLPDAGVHASLLRTLAARIVYGTNGGDAAAQPGRGSSPTERCIPYEPGLRTPERGLLSFALRSSAHLPPRLRSAPPPPSPRTPRP
jgi:hypothetical protein